MKIIIHSKSGCPMCDEVENICKTYNLEYTKLMTSKDKLIEMFGNVSSYPQVVVDGKHVGNNFDFEESLEPILIPNPNRYTVFPIKHHNLWGLYKKAQMSNWTTEELDFSMDMNDWRNLSDNEKHFIKHVLAFFASSDGIVFENINLNFSQEIQLPEAWSFYGYQCHNEMVHGETYSTLIEKYVTDPLEKGKLFSAVENIECIKGKAEWAKKWFDKSLPFSHRLIAFACVEGIFFSGSFCAIFWLKKRGLLPGLCFSNELISRDEAMHLEFAVELFSMLKNQPDYAILLQIITEAVAIEKEFVIDALPCKLIGMDSQKMSQYIEYVADRMLKQLGYQSHWKSENPFEFMENISLDGKTNFFEKRVGDYQKFDSGNDEVSFQADF